MEDHLKKAGYKEGQQLCAFKGKTCLTEIEQKIVDKIMFINAEISCQKESIRLLQKKIKELEEKLEEWQPFCPHPTQKIEYGPQGDKVKAEVERAYCCTCSKDLMAEIKAENN